jgi:hypothetical protein
MIKREDARKEEDWLGKTVFETAKSEPWERHICEPQT